MTKVREPAVAGSFYPSDPHKLRTAIESMLEQVRPNPGPSPKALIVPHAGYVYSGPIAATAYAQLLPYRASYRRVVLLGPAHRKVLRGLALSAAEYFQTPLGEVRLDRDAIACLSHPAITTLETAHDLEHSLEVQLPFLQVVLDEFRLVPLVVGDTTPETVAAIIDALWEDDRTLVVISSDLSHYLPYQACRERDGETCLAIEALDDRRIRQADACGATALGGLLVAARHHGLTVRTLDVRNSGDTAGDRRQVVGYGAWVFTEGERCVSAA